MEITRHDINFHNEIVRYENFRIYDSYFFDFLYNIFFDTFIKTKIQEKIKLSELVLLFIDFMKIDNTGGVILQEYLLDYDVFNHNIIKIHNYLQNYGYVNYNLRRYYEKQTIETDFLLRLLLKTCHDNYDIFSIDLKSKTNHKIYQNYKKIILKDHVFMIKMVIFSKITNLNGLRPTCIFENTLLKSLNVAIAPRGCNMMEIGDNNVKYKIGLGKIK